MYTVSRPRKLNYAIICTDRRSTACCVSVRITLGPRGGLEVQFIISVLVYDMYIETEKIENLNYATDRRSLMLFDQFVRVSDVVFFLSDCYMFDGLVCLF